MIQFKDIHKQFDKFKVLKGINLEFEQGKITALIGPNACGKTTLIKCLLGMVIPDSGEIIFDGKTIKKQWKYRSEIGYMPQIGRYPENMTIKQVIGMIEDLRNKDNTKLDKELYESFKLYEILDKRMGALSGGTRQKVSAYLAFLFNPKVLVLDEPTAGLDPVASLILKDKIQKEKENGKLIIVTSHILSELDEVINQIVYMEEGNIIFNRPIEQVKEETGKAKLTEAIAQIMSAEKQN